MQTTTKKNQGAINPNNSNICKNKKFQSATTQTASTPSK
jgi:hypothetical protein